MLLVQNRDNLCDIFEGFVIDLLVSVSDDTSDILEGGKAVGLFMVLFCNYRLAFVCRVVMG